MVGGWHPQRASAELSIFPVYGQAVHTLPGWLHFDMETLILVTLDTAQGHALSSLYRIVPFHILIVCGLDSVLLIVCNPESKSHYPYGYYFWFKRNFIRTGRSLLSTVRLD
jgi:hypothetical protein